MNTQKQWLVTAQLRLDGDTSSTRSPGECIYCSDEETAHEQANLWRQMTDRKYSQVHVIFLPALPRQSMKTNPDNDYAQ